MFVFRVWHGRSGVARDEKDISAEQSSAEAYSWLPRSYGDPRRAPSLEATSSEAPSSSHSRHSSQTAWVIPVAGRLSYPKEARIRRRGEFLALQRQGLRRHTPSLVVIRRPAVGPISRLGVTVSSRVGNSIIRNRVKRMIREIFRQCRADIRPPQDLLVIAKPGADTLTYAQVATEFAQAVRPAHGN